MTHEAVEVVLTVLLHKRRILISNLLSSLLYQEIVWLRNDIQQEHRLHKIIIQSQIGLEIALFEYSKSIVLIEISYFFSYFHI